MSELHQCPCSKATKCIMDEPCLGCETYSEWVRENFPKPEIEYKSYLNIKIPE